MRNPPVAALRFDGLVDGAASACSAITPGLCARESGGGRHRKYTPLAFTEHGAIMAATILNSPRATEVSVYVVRAFVRMRDFLASREGLARQLQAHEKKLATHDQAIAGLVDTIRQLMAPPAPPRRRSIGFVSTDDK